MIKRVFFILIAINLFLPYVYAQDCESMMEAGDSYFSQKKYDKALAMYSQLQRKCGENYAGVIKKIEKCNSIITENSDYNKCTTIEGCENYLNKYPNGRYVAKVQQKYEELWVASEEVMLTQENFDALIEMVNQLRQEVVNSKNNEKKLQDLINDCERKLGNGSNASINNNDSYKAIEKQGYTLTEIENNLLRREWRTGEMLTLENFNVLNEMVYQLQQEVVNSKNKEKILQDCLNDCERNQANRAMMKQGYVDLGLPSGALWKRKNEEGFYTYEQAVNRFGNKLPTKEQYKELKDKCRWTWTGSGYKVIGPNGNSIVLPAAGNRYCDGSVNDVGADGNYWTSAPFGSNHAWYLYFNSSVVRMDEYYRCYGFTVRLVQD